YSIAQLQAFSPRELETSGRLTQPMLHRKGDNFYQPITWEAAFDKIVQQLGTDGRPGQVSPNETFWYFSGRSSNEAGFLLQVFAKNNVNNGCYFGQRARAGGLGSVRGPGPAPVMRKLLEHAELIFVIGVNPASNHPRLMSTLKNLRRRGGHVIVINPIVETGL